MEKVLVVLLIGLLSAFLVDASGHSKEKLEGSSDVKANVARKGGGIELYREVESDGGKKKKKTGVIDISIGKIREVGGNETSTHPRRKEKENLDDVEFDVEKKPDENLRRHHGGQGGGEIKGNCVVLHKKLKDVDDAELTITVCVIKDNGTLTIDDEETTVWSGQLKFSVELENWPWTSEGEFLDIDIVVKLPKGRKVGKKDEGDNPMGQAPAGKKRPHHFDFGDNSTGYFSRKVECDNVTKDMPDGFPSDPKKHGNKYIITLRVPRCNSTVFYDPIFDNLNEAAVDDSTSASTSTGVSTVLLSVGLLMGLVAAKRAL